MSAFQIALFGAGRIGRVHAGSIVSNPRSRLKYVVDVNAGFAAAVADEYGGTAVSPDEALGDGEVDAIVVASSTDTHVDLIQRGIAAGKHVFCEKPIDLDIDRVNACLEEIDGKPQKLFVAFNRRFDTSFGDLARRVRDGEIGDLELLTIISKDPEPPPVEYQKVAGGLIRDMMIHDIDLARFILGEEPVQVTVTGASLCDPVAGSLGDIDTAVLTLQTETGKIATITNSRRSTFGYDQRIEAHGSKGLLMAGNMFENSVRLANDKGITGARVMHFFIDRYTPAYRAEWNAFLDHLEDGTPPEPTGIDGQRALMIADAGYVSLRENRTVKLEF